MNDPALFVNIFDGDDKGKKITEYNEIIPSDKAYLGIDPSGKAIIRFHAGTNYKAIPLISKDYAFIIGCVLYDDNNKIREYKAKIENGHFKGYFDGNRSISDDKDLDIQYYVGNEPVDCYVYTAMDDKCFYTLETLVGWKNIATTLAEVETAIQQHQSRKAKATGLYNKADVSCAKSFLKDKLTRDCSFEEMEQGVLLLQKHQEEKNVETLVQVLNSVCLSSLRKLTYPQQISFLNKIIAQDALKEESEIAVLRLINAIDSQQYTDFYNYLEADGNAVMKKLIKEIDDASIYFWDGDNYTNLLGALLWMFKEVPTSWMSRVKEAQDENLLSQIFNLNSQPYNSNRESISGLEVVGTARYYGYYNNQTGKIKIVQQERIIRSGGVGDDAFVSDDWVEVYTFDEVDPLTPIIITTDNELSIVQTLLDGDRSQPSGVYIVPAIFLAYRNDKSFNEQLKQSTFVALDIATIVGSGGTALATKIHWARRVIAFIEIGGAVANIGVNTGSITDPAAQEAIGYFNMAMGGIGLKHLGKGVVSAAKAIPPATMRLISQNQSLRTQLVTIYAKWIIEVKGIKDISKLSTAEQRLLTQQDEVFRIFGVAEKATDGSHISWKQVVGRYFIINDKIKYGKNFKSRLTLSSLDFEERRIAEEAFEILNSTEFNKILNSYEMKIPVQIEINNRVISYDDAPFSGMTWFEKNGSNIGREAFTSEEELIKTVLHEMHRLNTSTLRGSGTGAEVARETKAAFNFAEKAFKLFE